MPRDEDDDLYDEEFDFVDDDETPMEDSDLAEEETARDRDNDRDGDDSRERDRGRDVDDRGRGRDRNRGRDEERPIDEDRAEEPADEAEEPVDEYGRPEPKADYVVHVYEHRHFTRTIDRPFTPEDAEAFATEFNRTSKNYGRQAVTGKQDTTPKKVIE